MTGLDVRLLGEISIRRADELVPCASAKALELLALLVVRRDQTVARDAVAALLWPDEPVSTSRRHLRQALWRLKDALTVPFLRPARTGQLHLDPAAFTFVDVVELENARAATADVPGADLSDQQARRLEAAVAVGGEFLAAAAPEWCLPERARLQEVALAVHDQLLAWCGARGLSDRALEHGRIALAADPTRETTHRLLMRLHHQRGDRGVALRQYERCVVALHDEYGVRPSPATVQLYHQIRSDPEDGRPRPAADPGLVALELRLAEVEATLRELVSALRPTAQGRTLHVVPPPANGVS